MSIVAAPLYEDESWLRDQYLVHRKSTYQIGRECGLSQTPILSRLKKFRIPIRTGTDRRVTGVGSNTKFTNRAWLIDQYITQGKGMPEIGRLCGVAHTTISKQLHKFDIPTRNTSEAKLGSHVHMHYMNRAWLYKQYIVLGLTLRQIGNKCNVNRTTIRTRLLKFNISTRGVSLSSLPGDADISFMDPYWLRKNYITKGRPAHDIAEECGVSENVVYKRLKEFGIAARTMEECWLLQRGPRNTAIRPSLPDRIRNEINKRDGFMCRRCDSTDRIELHHIKPWCQYPELYLDVFNIITLCHDHHAETLRKENLYESELYALLEVS